ncbi:3,4dihydroxy-2-butanone-4-phosphate synthase [Aphelenchoides avenae]|nr:3,4dihydroxy-2-butanone-4-phosphate synthase [Aphelenchus avenae]
MAASIARDKTVAFAMKHSGGILYAALTAQRARELGLRFTSSDAPPGKEKLSLCTPVDVVGTESGISAHDRAATFHALGHPSSKPCDFRRPGHVFSILAQHHGNDRQFGHAEAAVSLCKQAGLELPVGVLGRLVDEETGSPMTLDGCFGFSISHSLKTVSIQQLAASICDDGGTIPNEAASTRDCGVDQVAQCKLPIRLLGCDLGQWTMTVFFSHFDAHHHVVLHFGDVSTSNPVLTRIHSECFTGDILGSQRCDCGEQLAKSLQIIADAGSGMIIYHAGHEGRGIGLANKIRAYHLQQTHGMDTYESNRALGFPDDLRRYDTALAILEALGIHRIRMLTNNPTKASAFRHLIESIVPIEGAVNAHNRCYLEAKCRKARAIASELSTDAVKTLQATLSSTMEALIDVNNNPEPSADATDTDLKFMLRAVALGERGKATAPPNPWVGCVLVDTVGEIIGEGFHVKAGTDHAEVVAVKDAICRGKEPKLAGATAYVTLEPCSHFGRTPPCDQLLIKCRLGRVVIALTDPDPRVSGRGVRHLQEAGISCTVGMAAKEAAASLRSYLYQRNTGLPWVVAKIAASLDGKIAAADGTSKGLISNTESRKDAHRRFRAPSQAVIVGWRTVDVGNPQLTAREFPDDAVCSAYQQPTRVVLGSSDGKWRPPAGTQILVTSEAPTVICTSDKDGDFNVPGCEILRLPTRHDGRLDFHALLVELGKRGTIQVIVEGGAALASSILKEGLINQFVVYTAPIVLGSTAKAWSRVPFHETMPDRSAGNDWKLEKVDTCGDDICATYVSKKALAKASTPPMKATSE